MFSNPLDFIIKSNFRTKSQVFTLNSPFPITPLVLASTEIYEECISAEIS